LSNQLDYELLHSIGKGGYGEVFLARSKEGQMVAIKVVYRASFPADDDRPYEREYHGVCKFERISHLSESQLQILHVGRRDSIGCFYYVMEAADDLNSGRDIRPETYVPRTLKSEMKIGSRFLHVDNCCQIGLDLASALENLHRHGLIHRDIKPANIIFVNGRPKLADPGLVTDTDETLSFVGTEGYIPPEGPGSFRADVYALGKVLYEMSTGYRPKEFPRLPENWEEMPGHDVLVALNRITTKACQRRLRKRYQSAAELKRALERLILGRTKERPGNTLYRLLFAAVGVVCATAIAFGASHYFVPKPSFFPTSQVSAFTVGTRTSPQRWTNSLGMQFVTIPGTAVCFCIWKTRVQDFAAFVNDTDYDATQGVYSQVWPGQQQRGDTWHNPGFEQGPTHPVCGVSWEDSHEFCRWLTEIERQKGLLGKDQEYRLPTDSEWSAAVGNANYPWGNQWPPPRWAGNYKGAESGRGPGGNFIANYVDDFPWTSPVGSFQANRYGLFDLGGNLWELCEDWYSKEMNNEDWREQVPELAKDGGGTTFRVMRGGSWAVLAHYGDALSARRRPIPPDKRLTTVGFRCVLATGAKATP
jgi:serine/threonine protein kinase